MTEQVYEPPGFVEPNRLIAKARRGVMFQLSGSRCVANVAEELTPDDLAALVRMGYELIPDVQAIGPQAAAEQRVVERKATHETHQAQLAAARECGDVRAASMLEAQSYELYGLWQSAIAAAERERANPSTATNPAAPQTAALRW